MSESNGNTEITVESNIQEKKDYFETGVQAVERLAKVTKTNGIRYTCCATGITILIALIVEFITNGDYVPHHGEIIGLIIGAILVFAPLITNSVEYKWKLSARTREMELMTDQLRIDADYQIARLEKTKLEKPQPNPNPMPEPNP